MDKCHRKGVEMFRECLRSHHLIPLTPVYTLEENDLNSFQITNYTK